MKAFRERLANGISEGLVIEYKTNNFKVLLQSKKLGHELMYDSGGYCLFNTILTVWSWLLLV